jgi:hypothetical protein
MKHMTHTAKSYLPYMKGNLHVNGFEIEAVKQKMLEV